ncbi:hypothetical protein PV328_001435 [Microctonus aethiopoides]|uniref:Protein FAM173B n=1 Tax=Microctonus aethiopoides TaxID=144406 RepID=A0AA39FXA1_9HYME|nr:hypothetical protein PV328_001435 [Microctonus aethiopoides]
MMNELTWNDNQNKNVNKTSNTGLFLIGLTGGVAVALSVISVSFVKPALRKICLPYVPATTQQVQNVFNGLQSQSGTLIDLGSGDGRLVLAAAKKGFTACGVELNTWLVLYSKISAYIQGLSSKAIFHQKDLWNINLNKYDNVILFGVEQMMPQIEQKFIAELKHDCTIVVCRFPLPTMTPIKIIGHGVDKVWIYKPLSNYNNKI